jgi:hypothetical protein
MNKRVPKSLHNALVDAAKSDSRIYTRREEFWSQLDVEQIRDRLAELHDVTVKLEVDKTHAVATARRLGYSWQQIADELGGTKQAAWERWHHLDADDSGDPDNDYAAL